MTAIEAELAGVLLRHASCLDRAAADPDACPRMASRLEAVARIFRMAASYDGVDTPDNTQEISHANT